MEKYIYRTPNKAIQILKEIINSKSLLQAIIFDRIGELEIKGTSHNDLIEKSVELLERLRYIKPKYVFALPLKLSNSAEKSIKEKANKSLEKMAKYNLFVLQKIEYQPQTFLLNEVERLGDRKLLTNFDTISTILKQIINPLFEGNKMTDYKTFTIHSGILNASKNLEEIMERVIEVLQKLFLLSKSFPQKKKILQILRKATQKPHNNRTEEIKELILGNTNKIIKFYTEIVKNTDHEIVKEIKEIEEQSYWFIEKYSDKLKNIKKLQSLIIQNSEYNMFKIFVGYDHHYFEKKLDWKKAEEGRRQKIKEFIEVISDNNFTECQNKILSLKNNYNQAKDYVRYQYFNIFLNELGKQKPNIAQKLIQNNKGHLEEFLINLISGIYVSNKKDIAIKFIENSIKEGKHLSLCIYIVSYVKEADEKLLKQVFQKAKQKKDIDALNKIIHSIVNNYPKDKKNTKLFIQTIKELTKLENCWWVNNVWSQEKSILEILSENDFDVILNNLLLVQNIDYHTEDILEIIAKNYPLKIVQFFEKRISIQSKKKIKDRYDAVPYGFHKFNLVLQTHGNVIISKVLKWFKKKNWLFNWDWEYFLKNIYSITDLDDELVKLLNTGNESEINTVLIIINAYQGHITINSKAVQMIIRKYPKYHEEIMLNMSHCYLISNIYNRINTLKRKKELLQKWKKDKRKYIQDFIKKYEEYLDEQIDYNTAGITFLVSKNSILYG